jgi:hypothetical protein
MERVFQENQDLRNMMIQLQEQHNNEKKRLYLTIDKLHADLDLFHYREGKLVELVVTLMNHYDD